MVAVSTLQTKVPAGHGLAVVLPGVPANYKPDGLLELCAERGVWFDLKSLDPIAVLESMAGQLGLCNARGVIETIEPNSDGVRDLVLVVVRPVLDSFTLHVYGLNAHVEAEGAQHG